ncbi:MAG TPA: YdeI/OmpD-associated family protein [Stellaceae bacterium]|nr:YdeI/OmpD-associated family protein [Stellaceae bacterium]
MIQGGQGTITRRNKEHVELARPQLSATEIIGFDSAEKWERWLAKNHASSEGIWIRIFKKDAREKTVTYDEALDGALCYGWIDGQKKTYDDGSWLQKFTPRRSKSIWSKRNKDHVARLVESKKMRPAGLREVESAKKDGRWNAAYDSASGAEIPKDFLAELAKNKKAKAFFDTLNGANRYSIVWRLQTAKKPETRARRLKEFLSMMAEGKKFHR